ncbi:hypothetical protein MNBD_PLANCTO02-3431 [hydrothermal vent metagenome]|uniref:Uncharacterized protein n=1 Tax=hydrothermal vent metagenome TaxID=652676 RepID=A0A3B1DSI9_9ZZZZ
MMASDQSKKTERKQLSANALICSVRDGFEKIPEHRPTGIKISLTNVLMSAFAMFSLKDPSLLAFDCRRIKTVPQKVSRRPSALESDYHRRWFSQQCTAYSRDQISQNALCFRGETERSRIYVCSS